MNSQPDNVQQAALVLHRVTASRMYSFYKQATRDTLQNTISFYKFANFMDLQAGYLAQRMLKKDAQKVTGIQ